MKRQARLLLGAALLAVSSPGLADGEAADRARLMRYPDIHGNRVSFVYADRLWTADADGAEPRQIPTLGADLSRARFSPDGSRIAFSARVDGNVDVYVVSADGSAPARRVTHHPAADLVVDWEPSGKSILFASTMSSPRATYNQLHSVLAQGGLPQRLPLPYGETAAYSEDGQTLFFTYLRDFQEEAWKRYYGGRAPDLWSYDFKSGATNRLTRHEASDSMPMRVGGETYFLSERDDAGRSNIWKLGRAEHADAAVTGYTQTDVRRPATDGSRIIFEVDGDLAIFDPASRTTRQLAIQIGKASVARPAKVEPVGDRITNAGLAPDGAVVIEARGDAFSYDPRRKIAVNLTASSSFAERFPRASTRGDIAYVSDRDGEYALYVKFAQNGGDRKVADFGPGLRYAPYWSPDGSRIALFDHQQVLWLVDVSSGHKTRIDQGKWWYHNDLLDIGVSWSPDGRWLAYARGLDNRNNAVFAFDTQSGERHQITSGAFNDFSPAFDPSGNYLLMLSHRRFNPTAGDLNFDATWTYTNGTVVSILPLRKGTATPGAIGWRMPERQARVAIDLADAEQRLAVLSPKPGLLGAIATLPEGFIVLRQGAAPDAEAALERYSFGKDEAVVLQRARGLTLADARDARILTRADTQLYVIDDSTKPRPVEGPKLAATIDHGAEAQQMFNDAWRYGRDFYYDPGVHGVDWTLVRKRLEPLVAHVTNDDDLTFIVREMVGELNGGHVYASATAPRPRGDARDVGLLGIDFEANAQGYRIAKIYRTGTRAYEVRSPLDDATLGVSEGDYLLAVNGKPLSTDSDPWAAFTGLAEKQVELRVARAGNMSEPRLIKVKTLASERKLRELAWVEENRRKVAAATGGRVGYIYVPNTSTEGQNELMIQYRSQFDKQALIIDERFNTGGALGDRLVELLNRPPLVMFRARNSGDYPLPELAHRGPKAMLINGWSYSGGDGFPLLFKTAKLGPLIGTRTWGGLIGPGLSLPLINGGFISPAPQRVYTIDGQWAEGNEGVRPDITIENDPGQLARGVDQQLNSAIQSMADKIRAMQPLPVPAFPGAADWKPAMREQKRGN